MRRMAVRLAFLVLLALSVPAMAQITLLHDIRMSAAQGKTRVVLDLSSNTQPDIFMVRDPFRLVVDLPHTRDSEGLLLPSHGNGLVKDIRTGVHQGTKIRVVLDLAKRVHAKSFMLSPIGQHRYRLVVDLYPGKPSSAPAMVAGNDPGTAASTRGQVASKGSGEARSRAPQSKPGSSGTEVAGQGGSELVRFQAAQSSGHARASQVPPARPDESKRPVRDVVIAIDAGHGGRDPGATGPDGVEEKNVTLAIAKDLKRMVDDQPHMKAVLTRKGDYYVGLRQRMVIARKAGADFFVSIHNDASPGGGQARGASVYVLSQNGASSEHARWLEHRENGADMVSGTSLSDADAKLADFVLDLSQRASIAASMDAGQRVLSQLGRIGTLHKGVVQKAAFVVLKSPDIPSILVETNYITNPVIEKKLINSTYQKKLAAAILRGIKGYFADYRPATYITSRQRHRVRRGDTLSGIAQIYGVSVAALKRANDLHGSLIRVGHTLEIPGPATQKVASRD